jgi:hypothetical protein
LDFNGGRDDLEFALVRGGEAELGEDLVVWFAVGGRSGVVAD